MRTKQINTKESQNHLWLRHRQIPLLISELCSPRLYTHTETHTHNYSLKIKIRSYHIHSFVYPLCPQYILPIFGSTVKWFLSIPMYGVPRSSFIFGLFLVLPYFTPCCMQSSPCLQIFMNVIISATFCCLCNLGQAAQSLCALVCFHICEMGMITVPTSWCCKD